MPRWSGSGRLARASATSRSAAPADGKCWWKIPPGTRSRSSSRRSFRDEVVVSVSIRRDLLRRLFQVDRHDGVGPDQPFAEWLPVRRGLKLARQFERVELRRLL